MPMQHTHACKVYDVSRFKDQVSHNPSPIDAPKTPCLYTTTHKSRLAPPHEARVQATRPDGVLVAHPGQEALQAETVAAVRRGAVPKEGRGHVSGSGREAWEGNRGKNSLALVGVPVVGLVGDAVFLVRLDQLVVVVHPHGAADDLADAGHCLGEKKKGQ